jgi:hypothetical protein
VSTDGNVGVISTRSAIALLSSFGGYYLSHLMMLGQLGELPLYELDGDELARQSREAWACNAGSAGSQGAQDGPPRRWQLDDLCPHGSGSPWGTSGQNSARFG